LGRRGPEVAGARAREFDARRFPLHALAEAADYQICWSRPRRVTREELKPALRWRIKDAGVSVEARHHRRARRAGAAQHRAARSFTCTPLAARNETIRTTVEDFRSRLPRR